MKCTLNGKGLLNFKDRIAILSDEELKEIAAHVTKSDVSDLSRGNIVKLISTEEHKKKAAVMMLQNAANEEQHKAQFELGNDYNTAVSVYIALYGNRDLVYEGKLQHVGCKLMPEDYQYVISTWKILSNLVNVDVAAESEEFVGKLYNAILDMNGSRLAPEFFEAESQSLDDMRIFIDTFIDRFKESCRTEKIKKDSIEIYKTELKNFHYSEGDKNFDFLNLSNNTGDFYINTEGFSVLTGDNPVVFRDSNGNPSTSVVVLSSEDGISRTLQGVDIIIDGEAAKGAHLMTVFMTQQKLEDDLTEWLNINKPGPEVDQFYISGKVEYIFRHGIIDKATGNRYRIVFQNPSQSRKGIFTFIEAETWSDVFDYWYKFTKLTKKEFCEQFGGLRSH